MMYGVYENKALVHWPPSKIFGDEIKVPSGMNDSKFLKPNHLIDHRLIRTDILLPPSSRLPR